jgi:hypothetical protein
MSQLVQIHINLLQTISKSTFSKIEELITHSSNTVLKLFSETAFNILKGIIPITPTQRKQLIKLKLVVKTLSNKNTTLQRKKYLLLNNLKLVKLIAGAVVKYFEI